MPALKHLTSLPAEDALTERLMTLQGALAERLQFLAQLDAQRAQMHAAILRLEGGISALQDLQQGLA
jgi:hypothetical protein